MPADVPSRIVLARARTTAPSEHAEAVPSEQQAAGRPARDEPAVVADRGLAAGDEVIDLTGPAPTLRTGTRRRRIPWLTVVLGVAVVAAMAVAVGNYASATAWRTRTLAAERRAARAEGIATQERRRADAELRAKEAAVQRRRALAQQLAVSESDAAALEARVITLASDTAQAQDIGAAPGSVPSVARVQALQAQVDSCVAQVEAARVALVDGGDVTSWQRALTAARASCEQVGSDADALLTNGR